MYSTGRRDIESTIMATVLPQRTEIPQISNNIKRYLPTLRIFGVRSSNCPIAILPMANMMLTTAISNQSESVVHIYLICCLLYTSDAADERSSVDLGGRRI